MNPDQATSDHKVAKTVKPGAITEINIKKLIETWATILAKDANVKFEWIDLEYKHSEVLSSQRYKDGAVQELKIDIQPIHYMPDVNRVDEQKQLVSRRFEAVANQSPEPKDLKFSISAQVTETRSHTLTWGLNLGLSLQPKGIGIKCELDLTNSKTTTFDTTDGVTREISTKIQGNHQAICRIEVWSVPSVQDFTVKSILSGDVPIKFNHKVTYKSGDGGSLDMGGHNKQFIPIVQVFQALTEKKLLPQELTYEIDDKDVVLTQKGKYRIDEAKSEIHIEKEVPLDGATEPVISLKTTDQDKDGTFEYAPKVNLIGNNISVSAEKLNEEKGVEIGRISKILITAITDKGEIPDEVLKAGGEKFDMLHKDRPLPGQHKGNTKVAHEYNFTKTVMKIE